PTQRSFDRGNEMLIDLQVRNQSAGQRGLYARFIVKAFEHRLRTFREAFTFFVKLTQNFKTRSLLRFGTLNRNELFFCACDKLLMVSELLFVGLNICSATIDILLQELRICARTDQFLLDSTASRLCIPDCGVQTASIFLCRFTANFKSGNLVCQTCDSILDF